jgi:hypothetical protein
LMIDNETPVFFFFEHAIPEARDNLLIF